MPEPISLYLVSNQSINNSNQFSTRQLEQFLQVKETLEPNFDGTDNDYIVAMYPDIASAKPCVYCHNEHPDSPKTDWVLGDVMGATTWTYPQVPVTEADLLTASRAVFTAVEEAYEI